MSSGQTFVESEIETALVALTRDVWRTKCEADKIETMMKAFEFRATDAQSRKISARSSDDETRLERMRRENEINRMREEVKHGKMLKKFQQKRKALARFFKDQAIPEHMSPFMTSLEAERAKRSGWLINKPF